MQDIGAQQTGLSKDPFKARLPSAARCYKLGGALGRAIESWPADARVFVIGTGGSCIASTTFRSRTPRPG